MGRPRSMTLRALRLVLSRRSRQIWQQIDRVEALDGAALWAAGVRGVLLDVDGTLVAHRARQYPPSVFAVIAGLQAAGLRVAVYSNADDPEALLPLGVPIVTGVPRKPARAGFEQAVAQGLDLPVSDAVVMVGDNLISDGGAVDAGLRFIYCTPLPGAEPWAHRVVRGLVERALLGAR